MHVDHAELHFPVWELVQKRVHPCRATLTIGIPLLLNTRRMQEALRSCFVAWREPNAGAPGVLSDLDACAWKGLRLIVRVTVRWNLDAMRMSVLCGSAAYVIAFGQNACTATRVQIRKLACWTRTMVGRRAQRRDERQARSHME